MTINMKNFALSLVILLNVALATGCNDHGNAQEEQIQFSESFSGGFVSASIVTDTNEDGVPANFGQFEGTSTFGSVSIDSLNEFVQLPTTVNCPGGAIEFTLVKGNFVKRFENGELLFGTWNSGTSCFDSTTGSSSTTQEGNFSGGTGQFVNATGPIEITFNSQFLANTGEDGLAFGGTAGTGTGTIILGG